MQDKGYRGLLGTVLVYWGWMVGLHYMERALGAAAGVSMAAREGHMQGTGGWC